MELWFKSLDFATFKLSAVSLFNVEKPEMAISHWARARTSAAKVGKGLSKDEKAQNLPYSTGLTQLIHAINTVTIYISIMHDAWFCSESSQNFFFWLDVGDGN